MLINRMYIILFPDLRGNVYLTTLYIFVCEITTMKYMNNVLQSLEIVILGNRIPVLCKDTHLDNSHH